jgi:hypothetical protein
LIDPRHVLSASDPNRHASAPLIDYRNEGCRTMAWILIWAIVGAGGGQAEFGSEQKCLAAVAALKEQTETNRTLYAVCVPK